MTQVEELSDTEINQIPAAWVMGILRARGTINHMWCPFTMPSWAARSSFIRPRVKNLRSSKEIRVYVSKSKRSPTTNTGKALSSMALPNKSLT